ncbi:MAG TPA: hypothetical protein VFE28_02540 [Candidatus Krumholzibacteria bacterium]|nr:hypothetical protein [Candidatus Krumholzibacteria bacterium]
MLRQVVLGFLLCAALAGNASAQISALDLEVSGAFLSKYIWNGFDRIRGRGLDDGPVLQPRVSLGMGGTPLHLAVGGSFVMNNDSELHETTYGVYVQRSASPLTKVGIGYTYYDDRVAPLLAVPDADAHEIWFALDSHNVAGVRTGVDVKYEISARDAYDAYFVSQVDFGYVLPLVPTSAAGVGLDLVGTTRVLYNTKIVSQGVERVPKGFSAWQVGLAADFRAARVIVTPSVDYQVTLEEAVNDEDPLWAGISVRYDF